VGSVGDLALGGRDALGTGEAQKTQGEVTQTRHHLRAVAFAHLTSVFIKGDVAHVVEAVLDAPMASGKFEKPSGGGSFGATTGQARNDLAFDFGGLAGATMLANPFDLEDLLAMREGEIVIEFDGGPDTADFEAGVSLVRRFLLRGEKR